MHADVNCAVKMKRSMQPASSSTCLCLRFIWCIVVLSAVAPASSSGSSSEAEAADPLSHDFYTRLGVLPSATEAEIVTAYRKGALRHHPDKNKAPDAQERFVAIAEAYETLSDPLRRKQYDRSGGGSAAAQPTESTSHHHRRKFDFDAADELFRSSFGDVVWKQWRPGKSVSGTIRRDGKVFSITISADGSSEEKEQDSENGAGRYAFIKSTGGGDGVSYQLSVDGGSLGEALSDLMVPGWLRMLPAVGMVVVTIVSWLPTICLGYCVLKCCFK
eukprot:COSAG02_NODE_6505_length_3533_cov_2.455154_2_plen_274_part_00